MQKGPSFAGSKASFAGSKAKGTGKPFNPNPSFAPNGYASTAYYYGGKVSCLIL